MLIKTLEINALMRFVEIPFTVLMLFLFLSFSESNNSSRSTGYSYVMLKSSDMNNINTYWGTSHIIQFTKNIEATVEVLTYRIYVLLGIHKVGT